MNSLLKYRFFAILLLSLTSSISYAERFWTNDLVSWHLNLNNGVGYVTSSSFPDECKHNRAQINFSDDNYFKAIWSYLLAASKTGEKLRVVLDHDRSAVADTITCVILSADAR